MDANSQPAAAQDIYLHLREAHDHLARQADAIAVNPSAGTDALQTAGRQLLAAVGRARTARPVTDWTAQRHYTSALEHLSFAAYAASTLTRPDSSTAARVVAELNKGAQELKATEAATSTPTR
jgi:hypothetical protein